MMDKVELCGAEQYKARQRYRGTSGSITSGQSGGLSYLFHEGLYTFGPRTGHGLCT
jgi:hypothetical protein